MGAPVKAAALCPSRPCVEFEACWEILEIKTFTARQRASRAAVTNCHKLGSLKQKYIASILETRGQKSRRHGVGSPRSSERESFPCCLLALVAAGPVRVPVLIDTSLPCLPAGSHGLLPTSPSSNEVPVGGLRVHLQPRMISSQHH